MRMTPTQSRHWSDTLLSPPLIEWAELEALLLDIAINQACRNLVPGSLRAVAKEARFKPSMAVWKELAILIWIVLDETSFAIEAEPIDGEVPMP